MEKRPKPKPNQFTPAGKRVLVHPDEGSNLTSGGIMLPDSSVERPQIGTVIAIGEDVTKYQKDERVLFGKSAGIRVEFDVSETDEPVLKEYWLMQETELFGTLWS